MAKNENDTLEPLTENEKGLLEYIVARPSDWNFDKIDLEKPKEEQGWESEETWFSFPPIKEYAEESGMDVNAVKGVFGSLVKKGYCRVMPIEEPEGPLDKWLMIRGDDLPKIRKALQK